jgi:hypothetical protein
MKRAAFVLTLGFFTPACGLFSPAHTAVHAAPTGPAQATTTARAADSAPTDAHQVGDFAVHRFSGNYEKSPLTLTEEVVAREDGLWVIDYTFEEESGTTKLRVRLDPKTDSVVRVSKLDGNSESSVPLATYEKMIDRTSFAADSNEGLVASEHGTCLVGPSELDCETKSYKVMVGDKEATLSVSHSDSVPGSDVAGDIMTGDGTLIYRSELVEMGNSSTPKRGVATR